MPHMVEEMSDWVNSHVKNKQKGQYPEYSERILLNRFLFDPACLESAFDLAVTTVRATRPVIRM